LNLGRESERTPGRTEPFSETSEKAKEIRERAKLARKTKNPKFSARATLKQKKKKK